MNEFIELRNCIHGRKNPYVFPLLFLDNYINKKQIINLNETILIKRIKNIKKIDSKRIFKEKDINELFLLLGENIYLDRFIVDVSLKCLDESTKVFFEKNIIDIIGMKKYNNQKLYHILDICIECDLDILEDDDLLYIFEKHKLDLDLISILIDYLDVFKRYGFKDYIVDLLECNYHENIKIQILNLLVNINSEEKTDESFINKNIRTDKNKVFIDNYIDFLNKKFIFKNEGITIIQSMFYGDFEDSGKGNNGGLAILLKSLGDEISKDERVAFIFTIGITDALDKAFISYSKDKHVFLRLPIYIDKSISDPFIKRELFIKRYVKDFLKKADVNPDIFHIRYLDNASRAISSLNEELNKKLVFTLTPDPHRNMFDESGELHRFDLDELLEKLNKIRIGDELIYKSDGILGIGDKNIMKELEVYFPQFKERDIIKKIKMIEEGIHTDESLNHIDGYEQTIEPSKLIGSGESFFDKPVILNVGRLAMQKGQMELLRAWSNSKLLETHNLLIIGGDVENPSKEEKIIIDYFKGYLDSNPHLKDKFFHKSAASNSDIRLIEKSIMSKQLNYPHIYLCSSIKEEFGIAILEAMSQGFLILGPIKGGVKTYIKNGVNGFLIDTSNWKTIATQSEKHIYDSKIDLDKFKRIQQAGRNTVEQFFSMEKISDKFLSFYLSLKGEQDHEI